MPHVPQRLPDGRFRNPWPNSAPSGALAFCKWMALRLVAWLGGARRARPARPVFARVAPAVAHPRAAPEALAVTWVGHSTVLAQAGGLNILTDPVWSARASPISWLGPRRWVAPGVEFGALPPLDLVLISHNHYDHLDDPTVRRLAERHPQARWAAPLGLAPWLRARGVREVTELGWWESAQLGGATVTATPAQHFSARGPGDRRRTLWCGWAVAAGERRLFFCGDSGYHPEWQAVGERLGPFDVAMIPIGAYEPRWFMRPMHMNPEEAVQTFRELRAGGGGPPPVGNMIAAPPASTIDAPHPASARRSVMLGIHWGTFKLTDEPMDEPPRRARAAWERATLPADDLWLLRHGETRYCGD